MGLIRCEVHRGRRWWRYGSLLSDEPPGAVSSHGRREVVVFGWLDGVPGVWLAPGARRPGDALEMDRDRLVPLADLRNGPYEREMRRWGLRVWLRWRLA